MNRHQSSPHARRLTAVLLAGLVLAPAACKRNSDDANLTVSNASGSVATAKDTSGTAPSIVLETGATPALGPGIQVTRTDGKSVNSATKYKLNDDDWRRFLAAAESLSAVRARDPRVKTYLDANLVDAGAKEDDAGIKYLEANDAVRRAITGGGLTVKDYFRLGIATAQASRFIDDPKSAPPTPALEDNARYLRAHRADLDRLKFLSKGTPVVKAQ